MCCWDQSDRPACIITSIIHVFNIYIHYNIFILWPGLAKAATSLTTDYKNLLTLVPQASPVNVPLAGPVVEARRDRYDHRGYKSR